MWYKKKKRAENDLKNGKNEMSKRRNTSVIDLNSCLDECMRQKILSKKDMNIIIKYVKEEQIKDSCCKIYWEDIEDENGMSDEEAKAFKSFYNKYRKYEKGIGKARYIIFYYSL